MRKRKYLVDYDNDFFVHPSTIDTSTQTAVPKPSISTGTQTPPSRSFQEFQDLRERNPELIRRFNFQVIQTRSANYKKKEYASKNDFLKANNEHLEDIVQALKTQAKASRPTPPTMISTGVQTATTAATAPSLPIAPMVSMGTQTTAPAVAEPSLPTAPALTEPSLPTAPTMDRCPAATMVDMGVQTTTAPLPRCCNGHRRPNHDSTRWTKKAKAEAEAAAAQAAEGAANGGTKAIEEDTSMGAIKDLYL
ncbi:hypothetical protein EG328_005433 [Venturia inaequalis]|uniref:Uncharacterized protein n=1 Tax=Venturia inaequalis TaxID=5025 RepID=A0A8H3ZBR2_VENIN|nr:hypothetical protein EG328_005433 [Venturia inaequalis]